MSKKKIWIIPVLLLFILGGYFAVNKVVALFHQPVHGIILYSKDKKSLEKGLENNHSSIKDSINIKAKYNSKTDTLVLSKNSAEKLIAAHAVNCVNKKGNDFTFKHVTSLSKTPALWTSDLKAASATDKNGKIFTAAATEYIVLGESSTTKKTLVLDNNDFQNFQAAAEYISVIEDKRDAAHALTTYSFDKAQIFNFNQK
ncbi:hypothetical protein GHK52_00315 [Lactococcus garvieae]|nr:hypothetical protein [Lactococcus garvieae]